MQKISRADLISLENYAEQRAQFRATLMAHKKNRIVRVGANASVHFEDRLTMQYQIQEMLRAEKIFEAGGIQEELDAYNPLVPDGSNLKATFMLEYEDPNERKLALERLQGIEDRIWVKIAGFDHVWAIADEDLDRANQEKTSSVHFLRFEFTPEMIAAAKSGAAIGVGIEHEAYCEQLDPVPENVRASLAADFD